MSVRQVRLPSGRMVGLTGLGDAVSDHLVVMFHPTPGSSGFDPEPRLTDRSGLHIIGFDRPGYGSTAADDVTVAGWVDELASYLRRMEITADQASATRYGRLSAVGWREGSVYATALAQRHPDLVERLVLIGPLSPAHAASPDHQPIDHRPPGWAAWPVGYEQRLARMLEDAMRQGDLGVLADRNAFADPSLAAPRLDLPALILSGTTGDATVADVRWYADGLTNARIEQVEGGADLIARHWETVLDFLRESDADA